MKLFARKTKTPVDPLDDLLAAALLDELTPEERAQLELRLQNDPAAHAAYQETLHMHDLLEKSYRDAQPDPAFEERMVSGVRRKIRHEETHRETAWESVVVMWKATRGFFARRRLWEYGVAGVVLLLVVGVAWGPMTGRLVTASAPRGPFLADDKERAVSSVFGIPLPVTRNGGGGGNTAAVPTDTGAMASAASTQMPAQADNTPNVNAPAPMDSTAGLATAGSTVMAPGNLADSSISSASAAQPMIQGMQSRLVTTQNGMTKSADQVREFPYPSSVPGAVSSQATNASPEPSRKLVRNAQLDLEVTSFQKTVDDLMALVNAGGGYVDSSNSQRGGNGKLQGTVVAKVLPEKLDAFLLALRNLGEIKNQSVSTEDVTRAYYDTQARLDNAQRMETQLQLLLQHDNGKVAELLQVERELGRVRGEIEQMQGEMKLYDFQVQYTTVVISVQEKDLNRAAAYLLKENDQFTLFAADVGTAFAQAKQAADDFKGQVLSANLSHDTGSDVSATLAVSVPPEQIEGFLDRVKTLGRIDNFTRQTERVANDGGESDQPSDETRTEKDRVMVNLTINADSETAREQTQLSILAGGDVDAGAQKAKADAAQAGATVTSSSFSRNTDGTETADLAFRLPLGHAPAFMETLKSLGKVESLTVHRDDQPGTAPADANAPAEISLHLHNEPAIVADDSGLWPTLRQTFGEGIAAFLGSVQTIGVLLAYVLPWLVTLVILAWMGRRVYVMRRK